MNDKFVFFDIETLSTHKNAVVLSAGFVVIDPLVHEPDFMKLANSGLEIKFYAEEQITKNRHVSKSTLDFWNKQGDACRRVLKPSELDIKVADFYKALEPLGYVQDATWYCKGPHFDAAILESLFENFKMRAPWGYNAVRDVRTALEWTTGSTTPYDIPEGFILHNAVHDAAFDAWQMLRMMHHDNKDS